MRSHSCAWPGSQDSGPASSRTTSAGPWNVCPTLRSTSWGCPCRAARYDTRLVLRPDSEPTVIGVGHTAELLAQAAWRARRGDQPAFPAPPTAWRAPSIAANTRPRSRHPGTPRRGRVLPGESHAAVARTCGSDPVRLFSVLHHANPAPHAALCAFGPDLPDVAVVSASPELFLRVDGRSVESRPIKGTGIDPDALTRSAKDRAENVMIVDLARNDLGRVCEYGSITVPALCALEAHPGLYHLVSTVRGPLRPEVGFDAARPPDVPARVDHRRTQAARAPGNRRPRTRTPRHLLRRDRLDRRRRRPSRTVGRDPHVHDCTRRDVLRCGRRDRR